MAASYLELPDYNQLFKDTVAPLVVNELPYVTTEERDAFNSIILTTYETDVLSNVPTCVCGETQKGFNWNTICPSCHTPVVYPSEGSIDLRTWLRVPDGIDGFIHPVIWAQLTNILNKKGYNILEWMTNARSKPPKGATKASLKRIEDLNRIGWERGLNAFIRNFDRFLELLPVMAKKKGHDYAKYLRTVRHLIFPKFLPLPTKAMLILENTQVGQWADKASITGAIDAARTIAHISSPRVKPLTPQQVEKMTVSVITNLVEYYSNTLKDTFCARKGFFRCQLFSSRSHFCLRGVITSITAPHNYEEIHIPWAQALEMFKIHIISKLMARGNSYIASHALVEASGNVYNRTIDLVLQELIAEAPKIEMVTTSGIYNGGDLSGAMNIFQRNPSLNRLSGQCFYITKVKTDLTDKTISWSILTVLGPNADFDGDEMNMFLLMDNRFYEAGKLMRPHYGIHDSTNLGELSSVINLPAVTTSVWANFVNQ